ncbi:hypothetical protein B0H14DRAFT_3722322 [Mycena olivaceomarginata]|nr:hypothetical protein B0H14DRAFT_3722322 [Mycena olivaceomarginata]
MALMLILQTTAGIPGCTISNSIPPEPQPSVDVPSNKFHPCSVRGVPIVDHGEVEPDGLSAERQQELHNVTLKCQSREHSKTCFKYLHGPPEPKTCRFDLHEDNFRAESSFDVETGEMSLRCFDRLVNNFNATTLEAMRCNMDIKLIGSGQRDSKLGEVNPFETDITIRAKKMLQKCAYAMISQQELSVQQVVSYLMDFEDHFTSHSYRNLYLTAFEAFINKELPSPECYPPRNAGPDSPSAEADELASEPQHNENRPPDNATAMQEAGPSSSATKDKGKAKLGVGVGSGPNQQKQGNTSNPIYLFYESVTADAQGKYTPGSSYSGEREIIEITEGANWNTRKQDQLALELVKYLRTLGSCLQRRGWKWSHQHLMTDLGGVDREEEKANTGAIQNNSVSFVSLALPMFAIPYKSSRVFRKTAFWTRRRSAGLPSFAWSNESSEGKVDSIQLRTSGLQNAGSLKRADLGHFWNITAPH